ncbi:MAG: hypothetical protein JXB30_09190 [Anaerolineae bacterium]|nr:hypothetical protein [Anaerolineae bacterium]
MSKKWLIVSGIVVRGHQVASRKSEHYPHGTIEMQMPFFRQLGLDLTPYYRATLNVSIRPNTFVMKNPQYTFRSVRWTSLHPPEHFSFSACHVVFQGTSHEGWVYYPHPETKARHFQDPFLIEILAPYIPNIQYGAHVELEINAAEVSVMHAL